MLDVEPMPVRSDVSHGMTRGSSSPLGATPLREGVNFSVFSKHATGVELLLFDRVDAPKPTRVIPIDPIDNRTYHYWHVFVPGIGHRSRSTLRLSRRRTV